MTNPPRKQPEDKPSKRPARQRQNRAGSSKGITLVKLAGEDSYELVHPPSVHRRADDMREVYRMLEAGEVEIAADELRWLLKGCPFLLEALKLLGELALAEGDLRLARAYFGRAYELVLKVLPDKFSGRLPAERAGNRVFFECGKALVSCLYRLGEKHLAREVAHKLLELDPADPLAVKELLRKFDR